MLLEEINLRPIPLLQEAVEFFISKESFGRSKWELISRTDNISLSHSLPAVVPAKIRDSASAIENGEIETFGINGGSVTRYENKRKAKVDTVGIVAFSSNLKSLSHGKS